MVGSLSVSGNVMHTIAEASARPPMIPNGRRRLTVSCTQNRNYGNNLIRKEGRKEGSFDINII